MGLPEQAAKRSARRFFWRRPLAILLLAAVAGGGLLLRQSGQLNALVEAAMHPPVVREAPPPDYVVHVIDERGQAVPKFQLMLQTADRGETAWEDGMNGQVTFSGFQSTHYRDLQAIDVLVRADGYASALARFAGADRATLFGSKATITLRRGEPVELHFRLPDGLRLPDDFVPEVYFGNHRDAVRIMWNPENRRAYQGHMPDFNFFNIKRSKDGRLIFQLAQGSEPFHVAIHRPGLLQYFESGPFASAEVRGGILEIPLPKPAALSVSFDPGIEPAADLPFDGVTLELNAKNTPASSYSSVVVANGRAVRQRLEADDLAPGTYQAAVFTRPKRSGAEPPPSTPHPGYYRDSTDIILSGGERRAVEFRFAPLDRNVFRGSSTARIRIVNFDGSPAADRPVKVSYRDRHYGDLEVFAGPTSRSGEVEVRGITDQISAGTVFAPYRIAVNDQALGAFGLTKGTENEQFTFQLPPRAGDVVPDIDLVNVATGARSKLHDFRGKVVCLEVWATWCGPCQEAMQRLNQMAAEHRTPWQNRVVIIPVSIDERPEVVVRHVKPRSWDQVDQYWSGADGATGFDSPACRALVGQGVPELLIIDRNGRISWIGHPTGKSEGKAVANRIQEALER